MTGALGETRVRVRYAETDQMGVVYHANYFVWFEVGRVELMRALGFDYGGLEREDGCLIAVVEATARYKLPARYDDELVVQARVRGARSSLIKFSYTLTRIADGALLCTGETTHVVVGRDMRKRALPARYLVALQEAARSESDEENSSDGGATLAREASIRA